MREVREVLPVRSAPQIPSAQGRSGWGDTFNGGCPGTWDDRGATVPALKIDDMVCAHNLFRRKGTKPILQVTVHTWTGFRTVKLPGPEVELGCQKGRLEA